MINQKEATECLLHDLPELCQVVITEKRVMSIYKVVQALVQLTHSKVSTHDFILAKRCFMLAEKLHTHGNKAVKCAIENVFIYSLDRIFLQAKEDKIKLRGMIPGSLNLAYMRQVMYSGC